MFKSTITVVIITSKGNKVAGMCTFNLAEYANKKLKGNLI